MKAKIFMLSALWYSVAMTAQTVSDSTDIFFKHLQIDQVVVTGLTGESKLRDMAAPVSLVTHNDLLSISSTNIIDAIARQPGMSQISTGSGISKPVIRGLGYNRLIVVNDGIRQEGQQWGDEHGIEIDAQDIGSVEIQKGPASLMYGSDAMAGVLIFHHPPFAPLNEMEANLSTEYQTNNGLFGYSVNVGGNKENIVWDLRYSGKHAHAYKNPVNGYVPNSQFREQAFSALLGINRNWGHSHLKFSYFNLVPSIIEGEGHEHAHEYEGEEAHEGEHEHEEAHGHQTIDNVKTYGHGLPYQRVNHYKVVWDNSIRLGNGNLKAIVGYQQNQRKEFEESADEYSLYFQQHTLNYDMRYQIELPKYWKVATGINGMYQRSLNKGEEFLIPAYNLFDFGIFATADKRIGKVHLTGGVRLDTRKLHSEALAEDGELRFNDFTRHFTGVTGSIGGVWHVTDRFNLRMNLSRGFRAPNMSELGSNGIHHGTHRYEIGNRDLDPEFSWQADLGADFSSEYFSAQVSLFANRISNYIYARRISDAQLSTLRSTLGHLPLGDERRRLPEQEDKNLHTSSLDTYLFDAGDARLLGFEAQVDVHPIHCLHFYNTFSYVDARQLHQPADKKYLPMTPAPRWLSDLKYEIIHNGRIFNNTYVAFGIDCNLKQSHVYLADGTETPTPAYTLLHLSAGTDIMIGGKRRFSLYLNADNLTNKAYQNHLSRLKYVELDNGSQHNSVYNMGRNITLKLVIPLSWEL